MSVETETSIIDQEPNSDRCIHLRFLGSVFATKDRAIGAFAYTEERLGGRFWSEGGPEEIDLAEVVKVSNSFAGEYFGGLASIAAENGRPAPTILNATDEVRAVIEGSLRSRGLECEFSEGDRPADRETVGPCKGW